MAANLQLVKKLWIDATSINASEELGMVAISGTDEFTLDGKDDVIGSYTD